MYSLYTRLNLTNLSLDSIGPIYEQIISIAELQLLHFIIVVFSLEGILTKERPLLINVWDYCRGLKYFFKEINKDGLL